MTVLKEKNTMTLDDEGSIGIEYFDRWVDTKRVVYYSFKESKDGSFIIKFYDAKRKLVKPRGK